MSDRQQGKFNVRLSHISTPGKLQYKTLIRKPEKSLKNYNSLQLLCVCVFTKYIVDRMKYKALYAAENYSSDRQTNFLPSLPRKKFGLSRFQIQSSDTIITLLSHEIFLCRKDSTTRLQIIVQTSRDRIITVALFSVIIQTQPFEGQIPDTGKQTPPFFSLIDPSEQFLFTVTLKFAITNSSARMSVSALSI